MRCRNWNGGTGRHFSLPSCACAAHFAGPPWPRASSPSPSSAARSPALPGVEEGTSYGTPAWRHKSKLLARLHQDGRSIVLKVGNATRDHLLQADPETFFITDHYIGYPMVLAHLDRLSAADLKKLLVRAMGTASASLGPAS